jgi:hypothetical protein
MTAQSMATLLRTLKRVAATFRDHDIPYAVGGGIAAWARGGPPTEHDIDLLIRARDVEPALDACAGLGMKTARPPEGWLVKAWDGEVLVDLIFCPIGLVVDDSVLARCDELDVEAVRMPVMPVDDLVVTKLLALNEHHLDYGPILEYARSLREQIDWHDVRTRTDGSPFAAAFFTLVEQLGLCDDRPARRAGAARARRAADDAAAGAPGASL